MVPQEGGGGGVGGRTCIGAVLSSSSSSTFEHDTRDSTVRGRGRHAVVVAVDTSKTQE